MVLKKQLNEENQRETMEESMQNQQPHKTNHCDRDSESAKMIKYGKAVGLDGVLIEAFKALGHEGVMTNFFHLII